MRATLSLALLGGLVAACGAPPSPACVGRPSAGPLTETGVVGLFAATAHLRLLLPAGLGCNAILGAQAPVEPTPPLAVEVLDPANHPLDAEVTDEGNGSAQVTFATTTPGWYHVTVTVEQRGSVQEELLLVAAAAPSSPVVLPRTCDVDLERAPDGTFACGPVLSRPDGRTVTLPGPAVALAGGVAWSYGGSTATRQALDQPDGGSSIAFGAIPRGSQVLVTEDELWRIVPITTGIEVSRVRADATGLHDAGTSLATLGYRPAQLFALRAPPVTWVAAAALPSRDAGSGADMVLCAFVEGSAEPLGCEREPGTPVGAGAGGLWTQEANTLRFHQAGDGGLSLPLRWSVALPAASSLFRGETYAATGATVRPRSPRFAAVLDTASHLVLPRITAQGITFEAYRQESLRFGDATEDLVWWADNQARTRILLR